MDQRIVEQLLDNKFTIDCPTMVLRQETNGSGANEYSGPGFIRQEDDFFAFKLFAGQPPQPKDLSSRFLNVQPGKILQDTEYFHLSATDPNGSQWEASRIHPYYDANLQEGYCLVHGHFRQIKRESLLSVPNQKKVLSMMFPGDIQISSNAPSETIKRIDGEIRERSSVYNIAKVEAAGLDFEVERTQKCLIITALSDSVITQANTVRILEALQFVLARPLHWCIIEISQEGKIEEVIRAPSADEVSACKYPPISFNTNDNSVWALYRQYLENYINYDKESWHPTFSSIYRILQAASAPLATEALALSVAVEGVLKSEFKNIGRPTSHFCSLVKQAQEALGSLSIDQNIKQRLSSALGQMKKPRAKDTLYALCNDGLICERHIKAWEKLRNSTAHAGDLEEEKLQEFLDKLYATYVLFYQLLFLAVGYSEAYTDYSDRFLQKEFGSQA